MRTFALPLAILGLALASCEGGDAASGGGDEASASAANELRDGFTLPDTVEVVSVMDQQVDGPPNNSYSFTLASDLENADLKQVFTDQLEANGYALAFEDDTGFAATGEAGKEMSLTILKIGEERQTILLFTEPKDAG